MRILVVEDEHRIANTIKKGLEQERYAVDAAYDGTSGYDLSATEDYDLIILDLLLPGMDGLTICRKLRGEEIHTPILMLTAKSQVEDKISGFESGADDYLTKPFAFAELVARVRALTRRGKRYVSEVLRVGDLTLDVKEFKVRRGDPHSAKASRGKEVNLSSKEFTLLEYLMRNHGRIVTKEQIISHVWDYEADVLLNTVEVYIKNLRKKIDLPFVKKEKLIKTVRGFGYKLGE